MAIALLSGKPLRMAVVVVALFGGFIGVEMILHYREINGFLMEMEASGYEDFSQAAAFRNYVNGADEGFAMPLPRERVRKAVMAMLASEDPHIRREGAYVLQTFRAPAMLPGLLACLRRPQVVAEDDDAREECAKVAAAFLSKDFSVEFYVWIEDWYKADPEAVIAQIERQAAEREKKKE